MNETNETPQVSPVESTLLGVSVRAWLAVLMTATVCVMSAWEIGVEEPLYSGFLMALGFYLGQKVKS